MLGKVIIFSLVTLWGMGLGATVAVWMAHPKHPIPLFAVQDCFYVKADMEPWHTVADGQVLMVGNTRYLAISREQRNTQDRYDGYKTYGFEIDMATAHQQWQKVGCPKGWLK